LPLVIIDNTVQKEKEKENFRNKTCIITNSKKKPAFSLTVVVDTKAAAACDNDLLSGIDPSIQKEQAQLPCCPK